MSKRQFQFHTEFLRPCSAMRTSELPPDVTRLLRDHIESYEQLELLLLLREELGHSWTEEALSARLGIAVWLPSPPPLRPNTSSTSFASLPSCSLLSVLSIRTGACAESGR